MEYRLATKKDINNICRLIQEAVGEMLLHGIDQWDELYPTKEDFLKDIEENSLYLAIKDEQIAALYVISKEEDEAYRYAQWASKDETAFVLHRFCVSPEFQNKGIGREVLRYIEKQVLDMGYQSIRLDVFSVNPFAQKLYRKNGYVAKGSAEWRKGRFDLMEKIL